MNKQPLFSLITIAYNRVEYIKLCLNAMRNQTYKNLEIVVVNNGALPEIIEYLLNTQDQDSRIKLVHFSENQFTLDDMGRIIRVCFNAGLQAATGEYVFYQSDDELISLDYVEKMVKLFQENPDCTSASGMIKDIDAEGRLIEKGPRKSNFRPRYMPGHLLALNVLCKTKDKYGTGIMFDCAGCAFSFKREELIKAGGYHLALERSYMHGMVPFGVTGYDETATLFWRRHVGQTNLSHGPSKTGYLGLMEDEDLIKTWRLEERWSQAFGRDVGRYVVRRIMEEAEENATVWIVVTLYYYRYKAFWRIFRDT